MGREEREDRSTERKRERERERKRERGRERVKTLDGYIISMCVCVCGRAKWFKEGEWFPRARLKGGDHTYFYFRMDDNNVDVDSVSAGDSFRRSSVFVNFLLPKETNVSSACEWTEGTLVFCRFRFRRWSSGRGGNAGRGRERMVPSLSHSMILPLLIAAHVILHIFLDPLVFAWFH